LNQLKIIQELKLLGSTHQKNQCQTHLPWDNAQITQIN